MQSSKSGGWVYVTQTASLPGVVKIGYSIVSLDRRMREISRYIPEAYTLVHAIWVNNPQNVEWMLHKHFAQHRIEGKEFFKMQASEVVEILDVISETADTQHILPEKQETIQTVTKHGRIGKTKDLKTSKHRGVDYHKASGKYRARLTIGGQQFYLGSYDSEESASKVVSQFRSSIGL